MPTKKKRHRQKRLLRQQRMTETTPPRKFPKKFEVVGLDILQKKLADVSTLLAKTQRLGVDFNLKNKDNKMERQNKLFTISRIFLVLK